METKTVTVYTYQELSDKAKEKARNDTQEIFDMISREDVEENIKVTLEEKGLSDMVNNFSWTVDYSHYSGVAFYGTVDLKEYAKAQGIEVKCDIPEELSIEICSGSHNNIQFSSNMYLENNLDGFEIGEVDDFDNDIISQATHDELLNIINGILENCKEITRKLLRESETIIENDESEEAMISMADANEWEFYANGEIFASDETLKAIMEYK